MDTLLPLDTKMDECVGAKLI